MGIEELKNKIKDYPISDIVGMYINVVRKGNHYMAVCPFHNDHNPSLHIDNTRGLFKCFVDNTGGDAIGFVQKYKNLDFIDSLRDICNKLGLRFEDYESKKRHHKAEMAEKVLQKAQLIYKKSAEKGIYGEYRDFVKKRRLNDRSIRDFDIGFAPKNNALSSYFQSLKDDKTLSETCQTACDIHLIKPDRNQPSQYYDTFRERIIFPIHNHFGRVVGFCGRQTKEYQRGKYINSQESFIFHKRQILYAFHMAKHEVKKKEYIILTEGHMDCICLHQHGFKNTVAVMGTSLGDSALNQIKALTKNIYLALDNDQAGLDASMRINELLLTHSIIPKIIDISPHKDPDEFIQKEGSIGFDKKIQEALALIDVIIDSKFPEKIPEILDRRIEILEGFFPILMPLKDSLPATERVMAIAKRLGMTSDPERILNFYKEYVSQSKLKNRKLFASTIQEESTGHGRNHQEKRNEYTPLRGEGALLREIALNPGLLKRPELKKILDFIEETELKSNILKLQELYYTKGDSEFSKIFKSIFGKDYGLPFNSVLESSKEEKFLVKIVDDIFLKLKRGKLMTIKVELKKKQKEIVSIKEGETLLRELAAVDRELTALKIRK